MGYSPLKQRVTDERSGLLTRPWAIWVELVQRLINDVQVRTGGATQTIDWMAGEEYALTLTANCVLTFSNPMSGGRYALVLTQDATGGWTVTWPATVRWPGGVEPTWSTDPGVSDLVDLLYLSDTDTYLAQATLGYSS